MNTLKFLYIYHHVSTQLVSSNTWAATFFLSASETLAFFHLVGLLDNFNISNTFYCQIILSFNKKLRLHFPIQAFNGERVLILFPESCEGCVRAGKGVFPFSIFSFGLSWIQLGSTYKWKFRSIFGRKPGKGIIIRFSRSCR